MRDASEETCVIFASAIAWEGPRHRQHEVAIRLARHYRIIYVEPPADPLKVWRRRLRREQPSATDTMREIVDDNVVRVRPGTALAPGGNMFGIANALNRWLVANQVKAIPELSEGSRRILWLDESAAFPYIGKFGESLVVYDCADEDWQYARTGLTRRFLIRCESIVTQRADVVFASSETLYESKRLHNPNTYWMPNAVDFEHFCTASTMARPRGPDGAAGARICVMGHTMPERTDCELLADIARRHPNWEIQFIGKAEWPAGVPVPPNLDFRGHRPYEELPDLLAQADVCLIPYRTDGPLNCIQPKKLYEYLAAGKPVVATDIPAVRRLEGIVKIGRTPDEFAEKVQECLVENADADLSAKLVRERQAIARENTWDRRVAQMREIVEHHCSLT